jgi:DNA recombination protein RmuC
MLIVVIALQLIFLLALGALFLRRTPVAQTDPGLVALAEQLSHLVGDEARHTRRENETSAISLRNEVIGSVATLGFGLKDDLKTFREDNTASADKLRADVEQKMRTIWQGFADFRNETGIKHASLEESLNRKLIELMASNTTLQDTLRTAVQERLDKLNVDNSAKLEEMRQTVDEKLRDTLQTRLAESFGQVTDQLTKVHAGLGEMTKLSAGVDDLSRIFTNVKSRGTIGEVMLETLLKQMLAVNQFEKNVRVKPGSLEVVEFAVKLPTPTGEALLPIDSKFPREAWERLETAYQNGLDVVSARKALDSAIRNEGRKICEKYISPPVTTSFAIMFLPTEGLYAEVMRTDGLQTEVQQNCQVTIAGPSTLSAILSSFQMGFHMLQMQQKGDEVWKVLASARTQFGKFEDLMGKMSKDLERVQNTIQDVNTRARAINRTLRDVTVDESVAVLAPSANAHFDGLLPMLAASDDVE